MGITTNPNYQTGTPFHWGLHETCGISIPQELYISTKQPRSIARPLKKTYHHIFTASCRRSSGALHEDKDRHLSKTPSRLSSSTSHSPEHRELPDQATGSPIPLQPVTSPSLLVGGCCGVSKQPQPNSNTSGFTKPMWPNSHISLYPCRRTTQPDSAWAADTHAYAGRENQTHYAHTMPSNDTPSDYTTFSNTTKRSNYHSYPQTTANSPPRMTSWRSSLPPFPSPIHHWQDQDHTANRYLASENTYVVFQGPNSSPDSDTPWKPYNWSAVGGLTQWNDMAATPNHVLAPQSTDRPDIQQIVRTELERLCNSWWILNQHSNTAHIPAVPETAQNTRWRTLCGWHYGSALYQKTFTRPTENLCRKCFKDIEEDDNGTSSEDELIWRPLQLADPNKTDVHTWCWSCCFIPFRDVSFVGRFSIEHSTRFNIHVTSHY